MPALLARDADLHRHPVLLRQPGVEAGRDGLPRAAPARQLLHLASGLFISSTTKNQMVAGAATFVVALMFWIINWFADSAGPTASSMLTYLSITQHFDDFAKGVHRHEAPGLLPELHFIRAVPHAEVRGQRAVEGLAVKRLLGLLGWLGVVLVLAAVVIRLTKPELQPWSQGFALAGLVTTALYALSQWRDIGRSFQGRNVKYGSVARRQRAARSSRSSWRSTGSARASTSAGTSRVNKQFTMSDQTKKILAGLTKPVSVHVFYDRQSGSASEFKDKFDEYHIPVEADHHGVRRRDQRPGAVEEVQHHGACRRSSSSPKAGPSRRTRPTSKAITNALKKLLEGTTKKIYFVQGHGEHSTDDTAGKPGYGGLAASLKNDNFEVAKVTLAQEGKVPDDATVVVVGGPKIDYLRAGSRSAPRLPAPRRQAAAADRSAGQAGRAAVHEPHRARARVRHRDRQQRRRRRERPRPALRRERGGADRDAVKPAARDHARLQPDDGVSAHAIGHADRRRRQRQDRAEAARDQPAQLGRDRHQGAVRDRQGVAGSRPGRQDRADFDRRGGLVPARTRRPARTDAPKRRRASSSSATATSSRTARSTPPATATSA